MYNRQASEELARRNNYPPGGEHDQKLQKKIFEALHCSKGVVKPNSLSLYVAKPCSLWLYTADNYSLSLSLSLSLFLSLCLSVSLNTMPLTTAFHPKSKLCQQPIKIELDNPKTLSANQNQVSQRLSYTK